MTAEPMTTGRERPVSHYNKSHDGDANNQERLLYALAGGVLLIFGLRRRTLLGLAAGAAGGGVVYRSLTGSWPMQRGETVDADYAIRVDRAVTINRPVEEVYTFWRNLQNLPSFMSHLESVTVINEKRSHWVAKAPFGRTVEWDAEIINEEPNELLAWRSVDNPDVSSAGSVRFGQAPGDRGTEVHVKLEYMPPAGVVGALVAKLFGEEPDQQVREDLRHLKQTLEAGEVATTKGQPRGPAPAAVEKAEKVLP